MGTPSAALRNSCYPPAGAQPVAWCLRSRCALRTCVPRAAVHFFWVCFSRQALRYHCCHFLLRQTLHCTRSSRHGGTRDLSCVCAELHPAANPLGDSKLSGAQARSGSEPLRLLRLRAGRRGRLPTARPYLACAASLSCGLGHACLSVLAVGPELAVFVHHRAVVTVRGAAVRGPGAGPVPVRVMQPNCHSSARSSRTG